MKLVVKLDGSLIVKLLSAPMIEGDVVIGSYNLTSNNNLSVNGIRNYSVNGVDSKDIYNNKNKYFEALSSAANVKWLQNAIVYLEFFNVLESDTVRIHAIGKDYIFGSDIRTYLGFQIGSSSEIINPVGWGSVHWTTNQPTPTGIITYELKLGTDPDDTENIIGKVGINWDAVPEGIRQFEPLGLSASKINSFAYLKTLPYLQKSKFLIYENNGGLDNYFTGATTEDYSQAGNYPMGIETVDLWYAKWDALMASAPVGYMTKVTLGTDIPSGNGDLPMYAYEITPSKPDTTGIEPIVPYSPKCVVGLAIHGWERTGAISFYLLIKQMIDNWETNPYLEFLRHNISFVIIPSINPAGWNAGTRTNFNGVDLNRNFPIEWVSGTVSTPTYPGLNAASEKETQYVMSYLEQFRDNIFISMDVHNFEELKTDDDRGWYLSYQGVHKNDPLIFNIAKSFGTLISRKFKAKDSRIVQDEDFQLSFVETGNTGGLSMKYYRSLGGYATTYETQQDFHYDMVTEDKFNSFNLGLGLESTANYLRMLIKSCMVDFNSKQK